jgi:hypothetical protein
MKVAEKEKKTFMLLQSPSFETKGAEKVGSGRKRKS